MSTRLIVIGIGGASCSGKTTLSKHLARLLPRALIIHQDDFAPPSERIPVHKEHGVQDWDDPDTGIEWPRMRQLLADLRMTGIKAAEGYTSYDYLNAQTDVPLDAGVEARWKERFGEMKDVVFVLVDGFILFYDPAVRDALDVKVMLRVPRETLKARREQRAVYALQNAQDAATGAVWTDPPHYFDNIVYPAYVKSHRALFAGGDVEAGKPVAEDIAFFTPDEGGGGMGRVLEQVCESVLEVVKGGGGVVV